MSDLEALKNSYLALTDEQQLDFIRFVLQHVPNGGKLREIMGTTSGIKPFDLDLVDGHVPEHAFLTLVSSGKYEVKRDFKVSQTGNIAVEVECRGRPSCLSITKAPLWMYWLTGEQYQDEVAVLIRVDRLRRIAKTCRTLYGGDDKASLFHLVPVRLLVAPEGEIANREKNSKSQVELPF